MKTIGIVLAGGLSSRFGSPKAFARIENDYFYERAINAVRPYCDSVVLVTRQELCERFPSEVDVIIDLPKVDGRGPLAGILSAMDYIEADRYIVLSCDMPFVSDQVIGKLMTLHKTDVTAVIAYGKFHPLVSVWNASLKDLLEEQLKKDQLRVMKFLEKVDVSWIDGNKLTCNEQHVFTNVNTPTDLERG